jgi:hypothetical protein
MQPLRGKQPAAWASWKRPEGPDSDLKGRENHRQRLRCMVALRLDHWLLGRIDASDVVQEAYLTADRPRHPFLSFVSGMHGRRHVSNFVNLIGP